MRRARGVRAASALALVSGAACCLAAACSDGASPADAQPVAELDAGPSPRPDAEIAIDAADGGSREASPGPHVAGGDQHTCARRADGTVWCWGIGAHGELGDGKADAGEGGVYRAPRPVKVVGISDAVEIACGGTHSCARLADGSVRCWGDNVRGQLGNGTLVASATPVKVEGVSNAVALSLGKLFSCAVLASGGAVCWGDNEFGQLGDGTLEQRPRAAPIKGLDDVAGVSTGWFSACARTRAGKVYCWGLNDSAQLGDGTKSNSPLPREVKGLASVGELGTGDLHSCAQTGSGGLLCWGPNLYGETGQPFASGPTPVPTAPAQPLSNVTSVALGAAHTCALRADKTVYCFGDNVLAQLGGGPDASSAGTHAPGQVTGADGLEITAGQSHTCVYRGEGDIVCWGAGAAGQLGNGALGKKSEPTAVAF